MRLGAGAGSLGRSVNLVKTFIKQIFIRRKVTNVNPYPALASNSTLAAATSDSATRTAADGGLAGRNTGGFGGSRFG